VESTAWPGDRTGYTAHEGHRGTRAIQRMVEFAPSTGGLALWVRHHDLPDPPVKAAANPPVTTDGHTLCYSAAFSALPLAEQTGLLAHEVLHVALRHPQRFLELERLTGDVDLELYNTCADAIVNSTLSHLGWLRLPPNAVLLDRLLARALRIEQDVTKSLLEWDVERLYRAIDDRRSRDPNGRRGMKRGERGGGESKHAGNGSNRAGKREKESARSSADATNGAGARPGGPARSAGREDGPRSAEVRELGSGPGGDLRPSAGASGPPELEAEQAREWSERILRAHAGDGGHSMLRALIADLPKTRTPWEQLLRTQLARRLAPRRGLSWSRPSRSYLANQGRGGPHRRLPWEPGYTASRSVARLAVIVDVSGSIEEGLMERFAREIEAITRRVESAMVLIIGDDRVQRVVEFEPGRSEFADIEFNGRGGTDFTPLLEEARKHHPDIAVVLTDLEGPARFRPSWPVLWAVPESHAFAQQPFGRKLVLR
jgi:predicted metal-dependent peptidase